MVVVSVEMVARPMPGKRRHLNQSPPKKLQSRLQKRRLRKNNYQIACWLYIFASDLDTGANGSSELVRGVQRIFPAISE